MTQHNASIMSLSVRILYVMTISIIILRITKLITITLTIIYTQLTTYIILILSRLSLYWVLFNIQYDDNQHKLCSARLHSISICRITALSTTTMKTVKLRIMTVLVFHVIFVLSGSNAPASGHSGRGSSGSEVDCSGHLPFANDVCWTNRGNSWSLNWGSSSTTWFLVCWRKFYLSFKKQQGFIFVLLKTDWTKLYPVII